MSKWTARVCRTDRWREDKAEKEKETGERRERADAMGY
jgi:hypothetical protein